MLSATTPSIEGYSIVHYKGIVTSHCVEGLNMVKDFAANISDFLGGRSGVFEGAFSKADAKALSELQSACRSAGGNALIGVSFEHQIVHGQSSMLLVTATGTAVVVESKRDWKDDKVPAVEVAQPAGHQEHEEFRDEGDAGRSAHPNRGRVAFPGIPG